MKRYILIAAWALIAACAPGDNQQGGEEQASQQADDAVPLTADTVQGDWSGQLQVPGGPQLWLVFHISEDEAGDLTITMDSPDQGAMGIAGEGATIEDGAFSAEFPAIGARFTMEPGDGASMDAVWMQGLPMPFTLEPGNNVPDRERPQEPDTRDYVVEQVSFAGAADGVSLAGELTVPEGEGPFPGLVLISGSGPQDRNEELMGHKPFLVLSDYLTRRGYAVLRYDDRGFGESTGDFEASTTQDFAEDAAAALEYLKADARIDAGRTAYVGHSEGGLAAPISAREEPAAALVLLAGPAVPLSDVILRQTGDIMRAEGASESDVEEAVSASRNAFDVVRAGSGGEETTADALKQSLMDAGTSEGMAEAMTDRLTGPWMRWAMDYDPVPALEAYDGPVLALFGSKDLQVTPQVSAPLMENALSHPQSEVLTLDGLNHLFQPAETGALSEYIQIETTFDERALEKIGDWLDDVFERA